nr:hypothetical protein [Micromonospora sp. WMMB482]
MYDYDGDGDAEVAHEDLPTRHPLRHRPGDRERLGRPPQLQRLRVLAGPEYLTMFDGRTGAALSTVDYDPPRGTVSSWGGLVRQRVDRFLAGTAYLDGQRPSLIMARGYYNPGRRRGVGLPRRHAAQALDVRLERLRHGAAAGQGNHQLSVADVDNDGRQEIVYAPPRSTTTAGCCTPPATATATPCTS